MDEIMSRSYKRVPCRKDYSCGMKRHANRYLRRNCLDVPSGGAYKKFFCSYDICDYRILESFHSYRKKWMNHNQNSKYSDQELYRRWYKGYKMK
jgi:hypothetical protein